MDPSPARTHLPSEVPADYRPLHKYLTGRFADSVVLTFAQIEDLLGRPLPGLAYSDLAWWISPGEGGAASPQVRSWSLAQRTASANLGARIVTFDRA